jgi:hypothetical protein
MTCFIFSKRPGTKQPETKRTVDNGPVDKTSRGTKCPQGQNILRDKTSLEQNIFGQNVQRDKMSSGTKVLRKNILIQGKKAYYNEKNVLIR